MQKSEGCFVNKRFPYNGGGGSFEIDISLGLYFYAYVHAKPVQKVPVSFCAQSAGIQP